MKGNFQAAFCVPLFCMMMLSCKSSKKEADQGLRQSPRSSSGVEEGRESHSRKGNPPPIPGEKEYSSDIIESVRNDPAFLAKRLSEIGPDSSDAKVVEEVIHEIAKANPPLGLEQIRNVLLAIDKSPGNRRNMSNQDLTDVIRKMPFKDAVALLSDLDSKSLRTAWEYGMGSAMAVADKDLTGRDIGKLKGLSEWDRSSILQPYVQTLQFESASQMGGFLSKLGLEGKELKDTAAAAANSASNLFSQDLMSEGINRGNESIGPVLFEHGFADLYRKDAQAAREYLVSNKATIPKDFYRQASAYVADRLVQNGDAAAAAEWKKESGK